MGIEKITYPVHDDFFKLDVWNNNIKAIVEQFGTNETKLTEVEKKASDNATNIGTLSNLTTTEKGSLVGAVNEQNGKLNILNNSQDFNVLLEHANTFAISTSIEDVVTCNGRGGTLSAENHRIIICKIVANRTEVSFLLLAKTKEELSLTEVGTGHDKLYIKSCVTPMNNTLYFATMWDPWVVTNTGWWGVNNSGHKLNVTINGTIVNINKTINIKNRITIPKSILDLADFLLFDSNGKNVASGFYPSSDKTWDTIGSLSSLTTTEKGSLVGAVNEVGKKASDNTTRLTNVEKKASDNATNIGTLSNLATTEKTSLVKAVNEVRNKVVKISSGNSTSISTLSQSGYMSSGTIKYVKINGFCTVFFDKFRCFNASGSLGGATLVNSSLPRPVTGFKINDEITVSSSGKLIGGDDPGGSITFTGTVTYPLYSAL